MAYVSDISYAVVAIVLHDTVKPIGGFGPAKPKSVNGRLAMRNVSISSRVSLLFSSICAVCASDDLIWLICGETKQLKKAKLC